MATPHPGKWETVLNNSSCVLNTGQAAVHSCVIYNLNSPNIINWKVLYFFAIAREGQNNLVQSRIWDPNNNQITAIRLIRLGVVTHAIDMDQRSVGLAFSAGPSNGSYEYTVTSPPNANIAPPGLYMLFVLRDKIHSISGETMIPSVAKIVKLT